MPQRTIIKLYQRDAVSKTRLNIFRFTVYLFIIIAGLSWFDFTFIESLSGRITVFPFLILGCCMAGEVCVRLILTALHRKKKKTHVQTPD